jgi:carbon-monoxide dehydrogenase medium subunit
VRVASAEAALVATTTGDVDAAEVGALAAEELQPPDDLHASGAQRQRMSRVLAQRAITNAIEEAIGA